MTHCYYPISFCEISWNLTKSHYVTVVNDLQMKNNNYVGKRLSVKSLNHFFYYYLILLFGQNYFLPALFCWWYIFIIKNDLPLLAKKEFQKFFVELWTNVCFLIGNGCCTIKKVSIFFCLKSIDSIFSTFFSFLRQSFLNFTDVIGPTLVDFCISAGSVHRPFLEEHALRQVFFSIGKLG